MSSYRYVVADVFTDRPLTGNQLAVFTDARELPEDLFQPLAREIDFSETAFVLPPEQGGHVRLRIFTPTAELPFAGHPVLGSAFVLAAPLQLAEIGLETGAGIVPVRLERDGPSIAFGWMRVPLPSWTPYARATELLEALGVPESGLPVEVYDLGPTHVYVELGDAAAVAALAPDLARLAAHEVGVNCFAAAGSRWKLRMFAPAFGVVEDAATGSAAGPLALHLARHSRIGWGEEIVISQGDEIGRPSSLHAVAHGSAEQVEQVEVGGSAVVVARGEFRLR